MSQVLNVDGNRNDRRQIKWQALLRRGVRGAGSGNKQTQSHWEHHVRGLNGRLFIDMRDRVREGNDSGDWAGGSETGSVSNPGNWDLGMGATTVT